MKEETVIVEATFTTPARNVWAAITNNNEMAKWYFKLQDFKPEAGFVFEFKGGPEDGMQYLHHCEIKEVIPGKKLIHTWKYTGYAGESVVSWELFDNEDGTTRLKLTHSGLESFPADNPDFDKQNFAMGWNYIINTSLFNYLQNNVNSF